MNIVVLTSSMADADFNEFAKSARIKPNPSNQNFYNKLIKALSFYNNVSVLSLRPFVKGMFDDDYLDSITFTKSRYEAVEGCDSLILITEWKEFRNPDFEMLAEKLKQKVIFDGRNIYDKKISERGFELFQIGC